jgi:hypothetical protein
MTERTVTEQQVIDALKKYLSFKDTVSELFPELPKEGELILVWHDGHHENAEWYKFDKIDSGLIFVITPYGNRESFDNYRRQTPAERGEG